MDAVKVDRDIAYAASILEACCKHFDLDVAYVSHMLQEYVPNVSAVSFLCCKYFIWMLHMFHAYVASVCSKCFICFRLISNSSISCCKCFMFQRYVKRVMVHALGAWVRGTTSWGTCRWGARRAWGPTNGACSSSSGSRQRRERRGSAGRSGGRSQGVGVG